MDTTTDLRKMLDELQMNRMSLENDRKAYDKAKREIKLAGEKFTNLSESLSSIQRKLKQFAEVIAVKSSDISLQKIKLQVLTERCNEMEDRVQQKMNRREYFLQRLTDQLCKRLDDLEKFLIEWDSSSNGKIYRNILLDCTCELYKTKTAAKEQQLARILIPRRNLEEGEREKTELERKYKSSIGDLKAKEEKVRLEIIETENKISSLKKERKEAKKPSLEASRLSQQVAKTRESIAFWEKRVSEIENEWLKNKRSSGKPKSSRCLEPAKPNFRCHVSFPSSAPTEPKESPPAKVTAKDPENEVEQVSKECCNQSDNCFNGTCSSNPRTFQFKKKNQTPDANAAKA